MVESKPKEEVIKDIKTFLDLEEKIVKSGKCCSCGACVAYCEGQSFDVIKMDDYTPRFKSEKNAENCTECGICYYICPETEPILNLINEKHLVKDEIGNVIDIIAAKTKEKSIEEAGQDGGIVTTILFHLFNSHDIDAAIVSDYDENFKPSPKLILDKNGLLNSAGTRYSISSQILPLKDLYNLPLDTLKEKGIFDIEQLRVAFVGTPCQARAIAKMKFLSIKPAHVIKYIISLFCFENFHHDQLYEIIKKEIGTEPSNIKKTWIKKNFFVRDKNNNEFEVDLKTLNPAVRSHCRECDEFTGKFSDISVGSSGAPKGYSILIVRTETGKRIVNDLLSRGLIDQYMVPREESGKWKEKKLNKFKELLSNKITK